MALIENQFGHILLLKQKRGNRFWTLPGGKVRPGESLVQALKREVNEETGLKIEPPVFLHFFERPKKGVITFLFRAAIKGKSDIIYPKANEIETARFWSFLPKGASPSLLFFWKKIKSSPHFGG